MEKLKMQSLDKVDVNVEKVGMLFPNCITERLSKSGELERVIDFDILKQELSKNIVEDREERYQFTWPDKRKAILKGNKAINKTLRPCREESVDFDNTQNLYIEGDNLDVLKLLQETYLEKVKMIYIDPPYNTGKDFIYPDNFSQSQTEYDENSGDYDDEGNRLVKNLDTNGRFHTDWLNMMYPRLKIARDLLKDDGVIFISIDDNEVHNLRKICDEIFGAGNFIAIVSRVMKSGGAKGRFFSPNIEYIVIYSKNINKIANFKEPISEEIIKKLYTSTEVIGKNAGEKYRPFGLYQSSLDARPNQRYYVECPDRSLVIPPGETMPLKLADGESVLPKKTDGCWRWSKERYLEEKANGNITFKKSKGVLINSNNIISEWNVYTKIWLKEREKEGSVPVNLITKFENRLSTKELKDLNIPFDFAKPIALISFLIKIANITSNDIILDFFSGSASTAHAVMQLNAEDGGNRKHIMVQLPEQTDENSEAFKAGYKNICEIGKERIRLAGANIKADIDKKNKNLELGQEAKKCPDIGFRVLKVDSTNMKDIYRTPEELDIRDLDGYIDNIKEDRSPQDLLFQVMLNLGVELSSKILQETIANKTVFNVGNENYLMACFDKDITEEIITQIAKQKPYYFVMRDYSMENDSLAINFEQIFKTYSPETICKIL